MKKDKKEMEQSVLWFLFPKLATDEVYIMPFSRQEFIKAHNESVFDAIVNNTILPRHEEIKKTIQYIIYKEQESIEDHPATGDSWINQGLYYKRRR